MNINSKVNIILISILTNFVLVNPLMSADIIDGKSEDKFAGVKKNEQVLTDNETRILSSQDTPAGYETYIFTHELIFGALLGLITAVWFYAFLTRKRPLF